MWFTRKKDTDASSTMPQEPPAGSKSDKTRPAPSRSSTIRITKAPIVEEPEEDPEVPIKKANHAPRRRPTRSASVSGFWPKRMNTTTRNAKDDTEILHRPGHQKARSETAVVQAKKHGQPSSNSESHAESGEGKCHLALLRKRLIVFLVITTKAEAPAWLLNAFTALEFITSEHPKAMSVISAILITAGSLPAIPAIAAGAGGAVLASSAAHAIGAIAVAAGQALSAGVAHSQTKQGGNNGGHH